MFNRILKTCLLVLKDNSGDLLSYFITPIINKKIIDVLGYVPNKFLLQNLAVAKTVDGAIILGTQEENTGAKFAIRKGLPNETQRHLAIENEPHELNSFSGEIKTGYGKGIKTLLYSDNAILKIKDKSFITNVEYHEHIADKAGKHYDLAIKTLKSKTPQFELNILRGEGIKGRYSFTRTPKGYIVQRMKDYSVLIPKPDFRLKQPNDLEHFNTDEYIAERKIDGSLGNIFVKDYRAILRSHRETASPYYDKVPQIEFLNNKSNIYLFRLLFPGPNLNGTVLQGEIVHPDGVSRVSGLLNAHADKSQLFQSKDGKAQLYVWNIIKYKGKDYSDSPYYVRRYLLERVVSEIQLFNKNWNVVDCNDRNESIDSFYNRIVTDPRGLPYGEGIVIKHKTNNDIWFKVKDHDLIDAEILDVVPGAVGTRLYESTGAILVRDLKTGAIGEIGTGFSDSIRQKIWDNRNNIIGAVIKAKVMEVTPKSLRAGVFKGFHPDPRKSGIGHEFALQIMSEAIAGGNPEEANQTLFKIKSASGWRKKF